MRQKFQLFIASLDRFCRRLRLENVGLILLAFFGAWAPPIRADESSDAKVLLQFERQMAQAWVQRDVRTLDEILADDYALSGTADSPLNKSEYVAGVDNPEFHTTSATIQDLRIHIYGDAAIATGCATYHGWSNKSGRFVSRFRFTDTFIRRDRTWKCVATHASALTTE
ncbi:MAG: nuclear transport factor 2 family protein [Verrucomicrobia bacterium]|nr:nuclear transport factor 2 family protein [Verrucomicrobiota bacterium]